MFLEKIVNNLIIQISLCLLLFLYLNDISDTYNIYINEIDICHFIIIALLLVLIIKIREYYTLSVILLYSLSMVVLSPYS